MGVGAARLYPMSAGAPPDLRGSVPGQGDGLAGFEFQQLPGERVRGTVWFCGGVSPRQRGGQPLPCHQAQSTVNIHRSYGPGTYKHKDTKPSIFLWIRYLNKEVSRIMPLPMKGRVENVREACWKRII